MNKDKPSMVEVWVGAKPKEPTQLIDGVAAWWNWLAAWVENIHDYLCRRSNE